MQFKDFDAIIGHNDFVAQGVAWAMQKRGLQAGREILLCGEGDYPELRHAFPSISTLSYDKKFLAARACEILKRLLAENRPLGERILVPSSLILRETA